VTATLGYEIPAHLYSPVKSTRTLIAKAIGRESFSFFYTFENVLSEMLEFHCVSFACLNFTPMELLKNIENHRRFLNVFENVISEMLELHCVLLHV